MSISTTAEAMRAYRGPALFSAGFRPFFLCAALISALSIPLWIVSHLLGDGDLAGASGRDWHVHEMFFGYLGAVIAGFLLTAVPNWTGRLPVTGRGLAVLVTLWLAGRVAMLFTAEHPAAAGVADSAFLIVFAGVIWREILTGKAWKNLPVCLLVTVLAAANVAFHLRAVWPAIGGTPERAALSVAVLLMALIGGRVIPSFTQNWILQRRIDAKPAPFGWVDRLALGVTGVAALGWVVAPWSEVTGWALVCAGLCALARLSRWNGWRTAAEPLVWILHLGYAWLGGGLMLLGAGVLLPEQVPYVAGVHALTAGAIGVMTLAIMTRASLGHTGRPRTAGRTTTAIYLMVNLAAVLRVAAPFFMGQHAVLLTASAVAWSAAFAGFALAYAPMLTRPKGAAVSASPPRRP